MHFIACKGFFGYDKKGPAVKVEVKEMRAFHPGAKGRPLPALTSPIIFYSKISYRQSCPKTIFKSGCFAVNNLRQQEPKKYHQDKP